MINLRYHIVSLVAMFLALGLGVLMGTTVVDQGVVKALEARINSAGRRADSLEATITRLESEVGIWRTFGDEVLAADIAGRLNGRSIVLVVDPSADASVVTIVAATVSAAGGVIAGQVGLEEKWALRDEGAAEQLGLAVNVEPSNHEVLLEAASRGLAARLAASADPEAAGDLIGALRTGGFLSLEAVAPGPFPPRAALFVIVGPGPSGAADLIERVDLPLVRALGQGRGVVVVEPLGALKSLAEAVRADGPAARQVATVDHVDVAPGRLSLAHALAELAAGRPASHFGVRSGAEGVAPGRTTGGDG